MRENFLDGAGAQPISWWMFEDAASPFLDGNTTNHNDLSGGSPGNDHKQGSASLLLSASNANRTFVNLSANFPLKGATTDFTMGGWIKVPNTVDSSILEFFDDATHVTILDIGPAWAGNGKFFWDFRSGGVSINGDTNQFITEQWIHVVMRWQGSTDDELSLWVNNVKQSTTRIVAAVNLMTAATFKLITSAGGNGTLLYDEWFTFAVALTDAQIADVYNYGLDGTQSRAVARADYSQFPKPLERQPITAGRVI